MVLAETMASGYGDKAAAPMSDWAVRRIGADPPEVLPALASETGARIMEALGVPSALLVASADGTSQREALRRWVHCHVASLRFTHSLPSSVGLMRCTPPALLPAQRAASLASSRAELI